MRRVTRSTRPAVSTDRDEAGEWVAVGTGRKAKKAKKENNLDSGAVASTTDSLVGVPNRNVDDERFLGNFCYQNAVITAMLALPRLRDQITQPEALKCMTKKQASFARVAMALKDRKSRKLKTAINSFRKSEETQPNPAEFPPDMQHDAVDFIQEMANHYLPSLPDSHGIDLCGDCDAKFHSGDKVPGPTTISLRLASATAGCTHCKSPHVEETTVAGSSLQIDLAQLVHDRAVEEWEKQGREVVHNGRVELSQGLITSSHDKIQGTESAVKCNNPNCVSVDQHGFPTSIAHSKIQEVTDVQHSPENLVLQVKQTMSEDNSAGTEVKGRAC